MVPPTTPSPHRFLVDKRTQKAATPVPSGLSHELLETHETSTPRPTSGSSSSQFATAPRFTTSIGTQPSSLAKPLFPISSTSVTKQSDQVQDVLTVDEDEEMLDNGPIEFTQPISQESIPEPEKPPAATPYPPRSPKRQKVDGEGFSSTPRSTPGRFLLPSTSTNRTGLNGEGATQSRPAFLMASLPQSETSEPLPDAFSPRRRGQKFLPGGLAAEVQSWVIEAGQAASQSRRGRGYMQGEDPVYEVRVTETKGDGPVFVRGHMADRRQAKVMLVDGQASHKVEKVKAGDVIGIRQPSWEVQVSGESWVVGVDWRTTEN